MKLSDIEDISKLTPAMQQYANLKNNNKGSLLFFRMGDFYELFFDDAIITAKELNITLTKRGKALNESIPMCGIPFHAANNYVPKLVKKGFEIAICEQTNSSEEMASKGIKGPLAREVTRIITPGTLIEENHLESEQHNFLGAIFINKSNFSISWLDVSTGCFVSNIFEYGTEQELNYKIENILNKISVTELLVSDNENRSLEYLSLKIKKISHTIFGYDKNLERLNNYFNDKNFEKNINKIQIITSGVLLYYIRFTFKLDLPQLRDLKTEQDFLFLEIDKATMSSLEIIKTVNGEKNHSLLKTIDKTLTASGSRLIKERLLAPSCDRNEIIRRQKIAEFLYLNKNFKEKIRSHLEKINDFERALSRISLNAINPKELLILGENLKRILEIISEINSYKNCDKIFRFLSEKIKINENLISKILIAIKKSLLYENKYNDFINRGYNKELDNLKDIQNFSADKIIEFQLKYSKLTKINSLKIKYNKVLGYHVEIRSNHEEKINLFEEFIHRQTTAQTVRYTTRELLDLEIKINQASKLINELEIDIYLDFKNQILEQKNNIFKMSDFIAQLDIANMTADQKLFKNYEIPEIVDNGKLYIKNGRHPVVEETLSLSSDYISNNCELNDGNIWLITGPNMAGKSTFLRQNAIIIMLAQAGLFIPAEKGVIGLVDKIFSRVGASDNLSKGQSTFMVEMMETASILRRASEKSFIIFDEVGRGTSTFDGLAIAWAILDHLIKKLKSKVLFATHYHELTALKDTSSLIKNYKMEIKEWNNEIIFLYKIVEGEANKSYGLEVAKLAGLPKDLIFKANEILESLEKQTPIYDKKGSNCNYEQNHEPLLESYINKLDLDEMTPLHALETLFEMQKLTKSKMKKKC